MRESIFESSKVSTTGISFYSEHNFIEQHSLLLPVCYQKHHNRKLWERPPYYYSKKRSARFFYTVFSCIFQYHRLSNAKGKFYAAECSLRRPMWWRKRWNKGWACNHRLEIRRHSANRSCNACKKDFCNSNDGHKRQLDHK